MAEDLVDSDSDFGTDYNTEFDCNSYSEEKEEQ